MAWTNGARGVSAAVMDLASSRLDNAALDQLFFEARTHNRWLDAPVDDSVLRELYSLARMAPTSANYQPMRLVFVKSPEAKALLTPALAPGNVEKTMAAAVTAIVAARPGVLRAIAEADAARRCEELVRAPAARSDRARRLARLFNARRVSDTGGAIARARLRTDRRLRSRQG